MASSKPRSQAPVRAGPYLRISSDPQDLRARVERQEADRRALAEQRGWEVAEVFSDNDLSVYSGKTRPAYERMLKDIEHGVIDAVVTWHLDLLHRRPIELEHFIDLADRHRTALAAVSGDVDLSTGEGRFSGQDRRIRSTQGLGGFQPAPQAQCGIYSKRG